MTRFLCAMLMLAMTAVTFLVGCNKQEEYDVIQVSPAATDPINLRCTDMQDLTARSVQISTTDLATFTMADGSKKIYSLRSSKCVITVAPGEDSAVHMP